jgi:hypothetical protein
MRFIATLGCLFSIVGLAQSVTISSTFGPNGTFNPTIGWGVLGPTQMAYPFTVPSGANYAFQSASLGLTVGIGTTNSVTISLAADGGGVPGSLLETFTVNGALQTAPNTTLPVTVISSLQPFLTANSVYWLIISAVNVGNGVNWQTANILTTPDLQASRASPTSPWTASPLLYGYNNPGAFSVSGISLAPKLSYPDYGTMGVSLTPTLTWSPSLRAISYDVYLGTSASLGFVSNTTGTSYAPPPLLANQTYYWQIVANDSIGPNPSAVWPFTTSPPGPTPTVAPIGVNPGAGTGTTQTFTFNFGDSAGFADLNVLDVLISTFLDGQRACYFALAPTGASTGYLYLVDDAGDGGYAPGTPMPLPSSNTVSNSQCTLSGTGSSISATGNTLTLTLSITFNPFFVGNKAIYMAARSKTQNSGWQTLGTWNVPGTSTTGPGVGIVAPARSTSSGQTYTFTFTDSNGFSDLFVLDILTNSFLDGVSACYLAYVPTTPTNGYVYLVDNAGDGGYAPGSPVGLSSGSVLQNSQCAINTAASSASASGNTLTLNLALAFNTTFAGNQVFFLAARNHTTGNSGWQAAGSVTVP